MKPELIKPIPKYIHDRIYKLDMKERAPKAQHFSIPKRYPMFYSYLTKVQGELVKITVATVYYYKKWYCKQVYAHGVKSEQALKKDVRFFTGIMGSGFKVGWYDEGATRRDCKQWYEEGWIAHKFDYTYPYTETVNPDFVEKFKQYRYSAYQSIDGNCIVAYLKLYEKYPQVEYLVKHGLPKLRFYVSILKRIAKNKNFCKFLIANKEDLARSKYPIPIINKAFKTGKTPAQMKRYVESWARLNDGYSYKELHQLFDGELEKFCNYLQKHDTDPGSYLDYFNACKYFRLDMNRQDNRYPKNFKTAHDKRINEYAVMKERADKKKRKELYKQFAIVAEKYMALQNCKPGGYAMLIAKSPAELIHEGEKLNHCVGKMKYEEKMANEKTLIFFVRQIDKLDIPFVTVEYSLETKQVLQCYGHGCSNPDASVHTFVNKTWLPHANRIIKKLARVA